ncbi:MAG TPA: hypothetical protein VF471_11720 [Pseudoxanthomonas sp.]
MRIESTVAATIFGISMILLCGCRREEAAETRNDTPPPIAAPTAPVAPSEPETTTALVLPGDFAPDTTLEQLQRHYGAGNVKVQQIPGSEGDSFRGIVLFPDDPSRRATLYFQDEKTLRGLSMVSVQETDSQWKLASGIGIGTPLAEVRKKNGKPFTFSGFDWDYGGTITDWQGGKLKPANDNAVSERMQLRMPESGPGDKDYPVGDSGFSSDDPRWADLGIAVGGISVSFPGEDDL